MNDLLLLDLLLLRHSDKPIKEYRPTDIKRDEHPHKPKIAPPVGIIRAHSRQVRICVGHGAKAAVLRRVSIRDVAAGHADVALQIFSAGLAAWGVKDRVFNVGTGDDGVGEPGR